MSDFSIIVSYKGRTSEVALTGEATDKTVADLGRAIASQFDVAYDSIKLLGGGTKILVPSARQQETVIGSGLKSGSRVLLVASSAQDVQAVRGAHELPALGGFDHELRRAAQRRRQTMQDFSQPPSGEYSFDRYEVWQLPGLSPPPSEAIKLLYRLASDVGILSVMSANQWKVGLLCEMPPEGKVGVSASCVLGINVNKGAEIWLRLRTDDLKGFRKYERIRETLVHELAHMVHSEHDDQFKTLNSQLLREVDKEHARRSGGRSVAEDVWSHHDGGSSGNSELDDVLDAGDVMKATAKLSGKTLRELAGRRQEPAAGLPTGSTTTTAGGRPAGGTRTDDVPVAIGCGHVNPPVGSSPPADAHVPPTSSSVPPCEGSLLPVEASDVGKQDDMVIDSIFQPFDADLARQADCHAPSADPINSTSLAGADGRSATDQPAAAAVADSCDHDASQPMAVDDEPLIPPAVNPVISPVQGEMQSSSQTVGAAAPAAGYSSDPSRSSAGSPAATPAPWPVRPIELPPLDSVSGSDGGAVGAAGDVGAQKYAQAWAALAEALRAAPLAAADVGGGAGAAAAAAAALSAVKAVLDNVAQHPGEAKYERVRLAALQRRLAAAPGVVNVLRVAGFVEEPGTAAAGGGLGAAPGAAAGGTQGAASDVILQLRRRDKGLLWLVSSAVQGALEHVLSQG